MKGFLMIFIISCVAYGLIFEASTFFNSNFRRIFESSAQSSHFDKNSAEQNSLLMLEDRPWCTTNYLNQTRQQPFHVQQRKQELAL